ncbi:MULTISPECIES: hypothetical protein [unclassified Chelatococcus]|uniref:hypothetical protein n=1 Tax=unclassified Chelatococcus TaxID=2638111 RepID=UPI001BD0BD82|nr:MULTISPECIES: hypothetical protein [unclassified Chelatococcus]MBS7696385.1 hypothetical protein [Chelatococcus sp. YT9]MBX3556995.1 hypothetical protein [Chelatococcus sp.]
MKTYICAAHAGGQGKTTVAQLLFRNILRKNSKYNLVSADFVDDTGRSKIGKFYPDQVDELGTGARLIAAKLENDPNAALRYWDKFGTILMRGSAVIDVGANVVSLLKQWAHHRSAFRVLQMSNAPPSEILLVCKAEKHAIEDVAELVGTIADNKFIPYEHVTVVLNEVGGSFGRIDVKNVIKEAAPDASVRFVSLPRCTSELWAQLEQTNTPIDRVLEMSDREISETFNTDIWSATAGLADLKSWVASVDKEWKNAGLFK